MLTTLRSRLIFFSVLAITGVLGVKGALQYATDRVQLAGALESSLDSVANRLSANLIGPVWDLNTGQIVAVLGNELPLADLAGIVVKDERGKLLAAAARKGGVAVEITDLSSLDAGLTKPFEVHKDGNTIARGTIVYTHALLESQLRRQLGVTLLEILLVDACLVVVLLGVISALVLRPIRALTDEAARLRELVRAGQLHVRAGSSAVSPEFRPALEGINEVLDAFSVPFGAVRECMDQISRGEVPPPLTGDYRGDFQTIRDAVNRCIAAVQLLVADATRLSQAALEGDLSARADASKHQGDFRTIIDGVNRTLDAVIGPLTIAAQCVDGISKGNIPAKITSEFRGDFDILKANLNLCIDSVNALVRDTRMLSEAAVAGRFDVRADSSRHNGEFRAIIQGINDTIESIVVPFRVVAGYCERISHGDMPPRRSEADGAVRGELVGFQASLNRCVDALTIMVADVNGLVRSAIDGDLEARADISRHEGAFRTALDGMNQTVDAMTAPLNESSSVLARLADRDLRARMTGTYRGGHALLKDSLNATAAALDEAMAMVATGVDQVSSASRQIASTSQAVAAGASEQAHSVQETSSGLEQMSQRMRESVEQARKADALAQAAQSATMEGAEAMHLMRDAVERMRVSAEGTSQIIRDINDIAFQTNLLALNAAVEAARAGEAGRGFAVVAEEVRTLAQRSKEAAAKTEDRIRQAIKEAEESAGSSKRADEKLIEIGRAIGEVTGVVASLARGAKEEASGIDVVHEAVQQIERVTQQNAASSEESSAAAEELSSQSTELNALVRSFQYADHSRERRLRGASAGADRALPGPAAPGAPRARGPS